METAGPIKTQIIIVITYDKSYSTDVTNDQLVLALLHGMAKYHHIQSQRPINCNFLYQSFNDTKAIMYHIKPNFYGFIYHACEPPTYFG